MTFRQPTTPLREVCPAYRDAILEFERLVAAGKESDAARAFDRARDIADIFNQGAEFGRREVAR